MHSCKATRERIEELVASGVESPQVELFGCDDCRNEFEVLKATLRLSIRAIQSASPPEGYWSGYHSRLRSRLVARGGVVESRRFRFASLFTSTLRVPIPVAVAVLLLLGVASAFAWLENSKKAVSTSVSVIYVPVEVPVTKEKVVTKVVYRTGKAQPVSRRLQAQLENSTFAKSQANPGLSGFKPLDEVKLTIIKGGNPNED